jgi:hypothetical protein
VDEQAEAGVAEDFGLAGVVGQADAVFGEKRDGVEKSNRPDPDLIFPVFELILYAVKGKSHSRPPKGERRSFHEKGAYSDDLGHLFRFKTATDRNVATLDSHYTSLWPE